MESYYKLENTAFPESSDKSIIIIRDNGASLDQMWIKAVHYHNQSRYYLHVGIEMCKSKPEVNVNDYFFEENNVCKYDPRFYKLIPIKNTAGQHHPRIYRPVLKNDTHNSNAIYFTHGSQALYGNNSSFEYIAYNEKILISSVQQLSIIIDRLETIFKNVYPDEQNLKVYSHEIRNVLILACTEVEAQLKGILKANNIPPKNKDYNTQDYVKLKDALKLKAYYLSFAYFPEISSSPFKTWESSKPTESLPWYNAYNAVKHDRETSFHKATLKNALEATSAICILLLAQYGFNIPYWKDLIGGFFEVSHTPAWKFEDCYLPPIHCIEWEDNKLIL